MIPQFKCKLIKHRSRYYRWRIVAKYQKISRKTQLRLEWIICYESRAQFNALRTCRHFGIAPKTFYKLLNRCVCVVVNHMWERDEHRIVEFDATEHFDPQLFIDILRNSLEACEALS